MIDYGYTNCNNEKKIYYVKCNKYGKFKNSKISYIFDKTLVLFLFMVSRVVMIKKEELIDVLKILALINNE